MCEPKNLLNEPQHVAHAALTRSGESIYRSVCPVCLEGALLVGRDDDGRLSAFDNCISCGQQFVYTDIEQMRQREHA